MLVETEGWGTIRRLADGSWEWLDNTTHLPKGKPSTPPSVEGAALVVPLPAEVHLVGCATVTMDETWRNFRVGASYGLNPPRLVLYLSNGAGAAISPNTLPAGNDNIWIRWTGWTEVP